MEILAGRGFLTRALSVPPICSHLLNNLAVSGCLGPYVPGPTSTHLKRQHIGNERLMAPAENKFLQGID